MDAMTSAGGRGAGPRTQHQPGGDPLAALGGLPGVPEAVEAARVAVDLLRGHRILRRRSGDVSGESALRGARASAALEGVDWALEEIRRRTNFTDEPEGHVVEGALRATAEAGNLLAVWRTAPLQAVARLHTVAAAGVVDAEHLGRPRTEDVVPGTEAHTVGWDRDRWVRPADVAARLNALAGLVTAPTAAPAVVVAAVAHGELLALNPFRWGNGLVARAAQRIVLTERGLDPKALCAAEVGHLELGRDAYAEALAGYAAGGADGVAAWIVHCARAVALGAQEMLAVCEALLRG